MSFSGKYCMVVPCFRFLMWYDTSPSEFARKKWQTFAVFHHDYQKAVFDEGGFVSHDVRMVEALQKFSLPERTSLFLF
jgi:hypothetical protein